jgi:predicted DCC family thiol-disulfide oxidoreductase YuxK
MPPTLTIFYNTHCPICDAGISYQRWKLIALVKQGRVVFEDINLQPDALESFDVSLEDIRRRLHAIDQNGTLVVGADVAVALWRMTPGQGWLASLFGNLIILPITRFAYDRFADVLYVWNRWMGHW